SLSYVSYGVCPLCSLRRTGEVVIRGGVLGTPGGNVFSWLDRRSHFESCFVQQLNIVSKSATQDGKTSVVAERRLRTCSTQTPHTEGSMLLSKKQTVLDDATVTREMKPTDSRVTYELSTDDTLAGVPNVMPYFEDERIRCIHYHKSCGGSICCFEV
uniref:Uncharacterized protein n=1 Tax=Parascaris univalens TaxID=6257 RepID=A0A915A398_PARUN